MKDLSFLETLQASLAGCRTAATVYSTAIHRVAAAFDVVSACVAAYDPVADSVEILHQARARRAWDHTALKAAVSDERIGGTGGVLVVPIVSRGNAFHDGGKDAEPHPWGVLALARLAARSADASAYTSSERQTLRAAAGHIAAELERRRVLLLDDVLDGLLRKTKPIDVYTHTLRELRRFIRYDHSASVMTMQRGVAQVTVRVEKVVSRRGEGETLVDSPRRGRTVRLTAAQARYLTNLDHPVTLARDDGGWRFAGRGSDPDAAGLWRVLLLDPQSDEGTILCYPLRFGGQMLGVLRLAARRAHAFNPITQYVPLLDRFARLLSVTLYRSEVYHQSDRQLQAIKEIGRIITQPMPVEQICQHVLHLALRVLHVGVGAVGLLSKEGTLDLVAHHGCTLAQAPTLAVGEGIAGSVVQTGVSRAVPDVAQETAYVIFNGRVRSELVAPITYDREVIGFLDVASFEEGRFREEDEEVITFLEALANQAAIAIKAARLRSEAVARLGASIAIDPQLSMAGLGDLLIDELRDKNEQLAATNERLAAANRAKSEFLAHMSHDLRGPLNVIVGLSNLLVDSTVAPLLNEQKRRESLDLIRSNGEVLASLIGNILDLSVVEAGKLQLVVAPFEGAPALDYLCAVARTQAAEAHKEIDIVVRADPAITRINADEDKFLRIMNNLLSNAVKFTPSGGSITVLVTAEAGDGGRAAQNQGDHQSMSAGRPARRILHVTVSDSGIGIAPQDRERIFDAFQQVESAVARQYHGTGLGLTVVRQLVELHGGRVWVESAQGEGSVFHIVIPGAVDPPAVSMDGVWPWQDDGAGAFFSGGAARGRDGGLSVLIVEDIPAHMNMMRLAVSSRGHTVYGAGTGEEALAWLIHHRPDVILLDMQLSDTDGFRVAERIKAQVETHAIPIVAVTADALSVTEERARASGCDAYLTKPVDIATLLATIDGVGSSQ